MPLVRTDLWLCFLLQDKATHNNTQQHKLTISALDTVKDQFSHLVYPKIKHRICEKVDAIGHRIGKRIMKVKTPLSHSVLSDDL